MQILRLPAVLARVGVSRSTLYLWVSEGRFPASDSARRTVDRLARKRRVRVDRGEGSPSARCARLSRSGSHRDVMATWGSGGGGRSGRLRHRKATNRRGRRLAYDRSHIRAQGGAGEDPLSFTAESALPEPRWLVPFVPAPCCAQGPEFFKRHERRLRELRYGDARARPARSPEPSPGEWAGRCSATSNPRLNAAREMRYGRKGSLAVRIDSGQWFDHEAGAGGGVIALVKRERQCSTRDALAWLESAGFADGAP